MQLALWPLQVPAHESEPVHAGRWPACGAPVMLPQVPAVLQASHEPVQARSQQTPSAQKPFVQSLPAVQEPPGPFLATQLPLEQEYPFAQPVVPLQVVLHAVAEAHDRPAGHAPAAPTVQDAALLQVPAGVKVVLPEESVTHEELLQLAPTAAVQAPLQEELPLSAERTQLRVPVMH